MIEYSRGQLDSKPNSISGTAQVRDIFVSGILCGGTLGGDNARIWIYQPSWAVKRVSHGEIHAQKLQFQEVLSRVAEIHLISFRKMR